MTTATPTDWAEVLDRVGEALARALAEAAAREAAAAAPVPVASLDLGPAVAGPPALPEGAFNEELTAADAAAEAVAGALCRWLQEVEAAGRRLANREGRAV